MNPIVVTGSASGIGAATCEALRATGKAIIGVDIRDADILADLSTPAGRQAAVEDVLARCGGALDGLVCCAGLGPTVSPLSKIAAVNYFGATAFLEGLFEALIQGSESAAVVVSSNSISLVEETWRDSALFQAFMADDEALALQLADEVEMGQVVYGGSKFALTCRVRELAGTWGSAGVRLNAVAPGVVQTPLLQAGLDDPRFGQAIRNFVPPLGRRAEPAEIAELIGFLMSPRAGYMHGGVYFIDGGIDAQLRPQYF